MQTLQSSNLRAIYVGCVARLGIKDFFLKTVTVRDVSFITDLAFGDTYDAQGGNRDNLVVM